MRLFRVHHTPSRVEQHEQQSARAKSREKRARACVCASRARKTSERHRKKGGERREEKKRGKKGGKKASSSHTRARTRTHPRARFRKRRAATDFAFCSRCFLCVLLPLSFSALLSSPPAPPHLVCRSFSLSLSPPLPLSLSFLTLDAPGKTRCIFSLPPFFAARFLRPFLPASPPPHPRHYLRCKSKADPPLSSPPNSPALFCQSLFTARVRAFDDCDESRLKIGYVEPSSTKGVLLARLSSRASSACGREVSRDNLAEERVRSHPRGGSLFEGTSVIFKRGLALSPNLFGAF